MQRMTLGLLGVGCALLACGPHSKRRPSSPDVVRPPIIETQVPETNKVMRRKSVRRQALMVSDSEYLLPPESVISLLEREPAPEVLFHAGSRRLVRRYLKQLLTREQIEQPFVSLAGMRINVQNFTPSGQDGATRLRVSSIDTPSDVKELRPPDTALFGDVAFSPDGQRLAVTLVYPEAVAVGVFDFETAELRQIETPALSAVWGAPCAWSSDTKLLCSAVLNTTAAPKPAPGPRIHELKSGAAPARTYSDLLQGGADDELFEHYAGVRLIQIEVSGEEPSTKDLPLQGLISAASVSPDGRYVLVNRLRRPYSRLLPVNKFPVEQAIVDCESGATVYSVLDLTDTTNTGVTLGPRLGVWNPNKQAEVAYVERAMVSPAAARDSLFIHRAPFAGPPQLITDTLRRVKFLGYTSAGVLSLTDVRPDKSWTSFQVNALGLEALRSGSLNDVVGDFGRAALVHGTYGPVLEASDALYFTQDSHGVRDGRGAARNHEELIRWVPSANKQAVVWHGRPEEYAVLKGILRGESYEFLLTSETPTSPPSVHVSVEGRRRPVAKAPPPHPELRGVRRQLLRFKRPDGVTLSGILYLPAGYKSRKPVPTVLWIYPRDYPDAERADKPIEQYDRYFEINGPSRFALLTQGYALLDLPAVPIVGEVKTGRDDFLPQLIESTGSAIDELVRLGVATQDDVYVMGRSFGAFAVANLLTHSRLFRTGIAMSGAYNRTLTPFGFQFETRSFWQNTDAYVNLSPFFFADRIEGSLLLIHGDLDANPGTPVLQSERFYAALVGNGVRARYVELPYEGHQFRGRDGVLHAAAEILRWLKAARDEIERPRSRTAGEK